IYQRLARAERPIFEEKATTCCYAQSDKQWIADPQGVHWETFFTYGESTVYGVRGAQQELQQVAARGVCCEPVGPAQPAPEAKSAAACCAG
ncbi:MAG: glyoxalase/bleomycin resistance/dioxygenase family protein, partial [Nevskiales bacterium]